MKGSPAVAVWEVDIPGEDSVQGVQGWQVVTLLKWLWGEN
jgi:hypothetical protein